MNPTPAKTKAKKLLFVSRKAPYGSSIARDALDALLAASAYGQDISVLFLGDGVFQLIADQNPDKIGMKSLSASLPALPLYDVDKIFVQESALAERGLESENLALSAEPLSNEAIAELMESQEAIVSF